MAFVLDLGNLIVHLKGDSSQYDRMMKNAEKRMKSAADKMTALGKKMTLRVTAPIVAMGVLAVKSFATFDDAMTKSLAIMKGITPALRREMESVALVVSKKGVTSAADLARSYFFLASAGLSAEQSIAALATVERFAVAGAFDMATATDLVTDAQSALGLTVKDATLNMKNMTRVSDVLTGANTLANASTLQFSKALTSEAGPAMKAYKIELEEGVAVLAAYADQGIKAEHAGSMFGRMLRLMTKGFKDNTGVWKQYGLNIYDAQQELKPMSEIIGDLSDVLGRMTTRQKIAALTMLGFQARSQQAILPLLGLQDRIRGYNEELLKMRGITKEVAERQLKSFASQMKILWNQVVAVGIGVGETLVPVVSKLNERIKRMIVWWNESSSATRRFIGGMLILAASVGPVLLLLGSFIKLMLAMKVAALVGTASVVFLTSSILALYAAVAGFAFGTYLYNEFKIVQEAGAVVVKSLEKGWVYIEYTFKQMVAGVRVAWEKFIYYFSDSLLTMRTKLPLAMGGITEATAKHLRMALEAGRTGEKMLEQNKRDLEVQLQEIEEAYTSMARLRDSLFAGKDKDKPLLGTIIDLNALDKAQEAIKKLLDTMQGLTENQQSFAKPLEEWSMEATDIYTNLGHVAVRAFDSMSESLTNMIMSGKANFKSFAKAVIADLLQIIIRARIAATAMTLFPGLFPAAGAAKTAATVAHKGGVIGRSPLGHRMVPASVFANAPRLHGGLRPNEFPTILEKGEAVIPKGGFGKQQVPINITFINESGTPLKTKGEPSFDGRDFIIRVMQQDALDNGPYIQTLKG